MEVCFRVQSGSEPSNGDKWRFNPSSPSQVKTIFQLLSGHWSGELSNFYLKVTTKKENKMIKERYVERLS